MGNKAAKMLLLGVPGTVLLIFLALMASGILLLWIPFLLFADADSFGVPAAQFAGDYNLPFYAEDLGGEFYWPTISKRITSKFGTRRYQGIYEPHLAIDIGAQKQGVWGDPLWAAESGTVTVASTGWNGGYGNVVYIDHGKGYTTRYAHMQKVIVRAGQKVERGQVIGLMGSTGRSDGAHVHFEVRYQGKPVDPLQFFK